MFSTSICKRKTNTEPLLELHHIHTDHMEEGETSKVMSFTFPKIYNFPPFFTKQPNEQTWSAQRQQWVQLILSYCRFHRIWIMNDRGVVLSQGDVESESLEDSQQDVDSTSEVFHNEAIDRQLDIDTIRLLFKEMLRSGDVSPVDGKSKSNSTQYYVNWNRPDDWAAMVLEWIESTGQAGTVLTLYEIANGDLSLKQEFHGIHPRILEMAIKVLVKRGRAQILRDEDGRIGGVKVQ